MGSLSPGGCGLPVICHFTGRNSGRGDTNPRPFETPNIPKPFEGIVNGIEFGPSDRMPSAAEAFPKCLDRANVVGEPLEYPRASDLDFNLQDFLVLGKIEMARRIRCADDVVAIEINLALTEGSFLEIIRRKGPAYYSFMPPAGTPIAATIGGRAAVLIPQFPAIVMKDDISSWVVTGKDISMERLLELAHMIR